MGFWSRWRRVPASHALPDPYEHQFLEEKRELLPIERDIIALAITTLGSTEAREQATAQLEVATYGGLAHPGTDVCFMIDLPEGIHPIADTDGRLDLTVDPALDGYLSIGVFIKRGLLDSVDLDSYEAGADAKWPPLESITPAPFGQASA